MNITALNTKAKTTLLGASIRNKAKHTSAMMMQNNAVVK